MKTIRINNFQLSKSDRSLIFTLPLLAILISLCCIKANSIFDLILRINVVVLGYHHVIATFTRISFSKQDYKENQFLTWQLLILVLVSVILSITFIGEWVISSLYFYWQWFHYTRQSYGVARKYERDFTSKKENKTNYKLHYWGLYLLPLAGLLYRSAQGHITFLKLELKLINVPDIFWQVTLIAAICLIIFQIIQWIKDWKNKELNFPFMMYMFSHYIIFSVGYLIIQNIDYGWLCINIWHNSQYLIFVWLLNKNRFKDGVKQGYKFISSMSQPKNKSDYFFYCVGISIAVYGAIMLVGYGLQNYTILPVMIIAFMTLNFHHYIIDGVIWKREFIQKLNGFGNKKQAPS